MDTKQPLSLFLVAVLAASVFSVVGIVSMPLQNASAQDVTIETSVDELGGTFFGHGAIQVVIDDADTDDDSGNPGTTIDVTIDVEGTSETLTVPDTNDGSQTFEFFLIHFDADALISGNLDGIAAAPTIFTFGAGGQIDTGDPLFTEADIEITYENEDPVDIVYDEVPGELSLDRTTPYGSTGLIHIFIDDQDGNLNPTEEDTFLLTDAVLNADLFDIVGGAFNTTDLTFEETGTNTGVFEGEVSLNNTALADDEFDAAGETVQMTLNDQANYNNTLAGVVAPVTAIEDGGVNDSTDTSSVTFEIDDEDGDIDELADVTFSSELVIVLRDDDQNVDSDESDTIEGALTVMVDGAAGADEEVVTLEETDDNTGVFEFDLSNGELRITFLNDTAVPTHDNGILELRAADIEEDLVIQYEDPLEDGVNTEPEVITTIALSLVAGALAAPETVGVNDEFTVTLTDNDLNNNPRTSDSYTILLNETGPFPLLLGGDEFGAIYEFDIELDGDQVDFGPAIFEGSITITETGINTGIFEFEIDMEDIAEFGDNGGELTIDDGSDLEISIDDFMADTADPDEDDVSIAVGKPDVAVDFSRTAVPIAPEDDGVSQLGVGSDVIVTLIITDPQRANQTNVEETFDFDFTTGTSPGRFVLEIDGDDVNELEINDLDGTVTSFFGPDVDCDGGGALAVGGAEPAIVDGVSLCSVFVFEALEETGEATGVFEAELTFDMLGIGDDMNANNWQDAEFTFNYFDDEGSEESGGFTFRGSDGIVTVDQPSAKSGTEVTITVEDNDLNLDDNEVDQFESGDVDGVTAGIQALLLIETEDEEIAGIDDDTFEETGEDTGVFVGTFVVGEDIPISDLVDDEVEQATNILITYDDEIDSTGGGGDELEVNVPIVSGTGSLQVTPELVGPATELTILVIDSDLDEDADSLDDYDSTDPNGDDFFISFSSDRSEVGEGSPDLEETGPNTGVFMFTIELITDEAACEDDDLDAAEFQAEGGDTESTIGACPGDLISIRYEDSLTGGGGATTISEVVEVQSFDPEFVADQESYNVGDRVTVTISDPDANRNADIADSLTDLRVRSDSDQVGEELSAIETGRDTGVFRLSFGTTSGTASGSISVNAGDLITVTYTDEFPADFEEEEEDKDFDFTFPVGTGSGVGTTTVTPPEPQDVTGQTLDEVSAGQQVVLTTSVHNNNPIDQPFVALIEVRDSNNITVFLAWQTGTLNPSGQTQVGLSWIPENTDTYTIRTFVISDLNTPQVLSTVAESEIVVS